MILTYRYRIKDASTARHLGRHARAVNFVWNYCCEIQHKAESRWRAGQSVRWPSAFDLINLCAGASAELALHSDTISEVCLRFVDARNAKRRCPRFRASQGPRRALGWIPIRGRRTCKIEDDFVRYLGRHYRLWLSRKIPEQLRSGAFSQDARGRWYFNIAAEVEAAEATGEGTIGIDLGLKTLATCSDGETVPALQHYRQHEAALIKAFRANNGGRMKAVRAKIANCRRDQLHKASTRLVRANRRIVVGNVSAAKLAKTTMAKSVLDAGWSSFRTMLRYKAIRHGVEYVEVDEAFTTRACSDCGSVSGPKGIAQLGMRAWECPDCGASHNRDVNAARNILRLGAECRPPAEGIAA
jgi:IS605 OrfB family transposase